MTFGFIESEHLAVAMDEYHALPGVAGLSGKEASRPASGPWEGGPYSSL